MFKNLFNSKKEDVPAAPLINDERELAMVESDTTLNEATRSEIPIPEDPDYLLNSPEVVGWLSVEEQELLFSALILFYTPEQSILDVGCGRADLFGYLRDLFLSNINYQGIDLNENMVNLAQQKYPGVNAVAGDIQLTSVEKADWVVGSGLFNLKDHPDMEEYAKKIIDVMLDKCNIGIAFNLLTGTPEDMADEDIVQLHIHSPSRWLDYLIEKYSKVICRADYLSGDVTFFILK